MWSLQLIGKHIKSKTEGKDKALCPKFVLAVGSVSAYSTKAARIKDLLIFNDMRISSIVDSSVQYLLYSKLYNSYTR